MFVHPPLFFLYKKIPMKPVNHSPCVNQCQLDNDSVCKGCGRTLHEIDTWSTLDSIDKENVFKPIV
jgi:predicted Fe-S protein YdhL (DUF1289 family)